MCRLALIGDHDPQITAHAAIPRALESACHALEVRLDWEWIDTDRVFDPAKTLDGFAGVWVVPGSPYRSLDGALAAIRYAREQRIPFLGTCGGFQHALLEIARDVLGIANAGHAEVDTAGELVVTPLACSLVDKSDEIIFTPGSRLAGIFGDSPAREAYRCNYGPNSAYRARCEAAGRRFTGFDAVGEIRAAELDGHPFFIGTLFQPERSALRHERHPLIEEFVHAATRRELRRLVRRTHPTRQTSMRNVRFNCWRAR